MRNRAYAAEGYSVCMGDSRLERGLRRTATSKRTKVPCPSRCARIALACAESPQLIRRGVLGRLQHVGYLAVRHAARIPAKAPAVGLFPQRLPVPHIQELARSPVQSRLLGS